MQTPLELTFRNMQPSPTIRNLVEEKVTKLERLYDGVTSCHVYVEAPHKQHQKGNRYEIHIEARVPGTELSVSNDPGNVTEHEDIRVAIRDAFDALERQLKKWKTTTQGELKSHEAMLQGRIVEIDRARGFGQIIATDGRLIYFHENSVVDGRFRDLNERDTVEFVTHPGEGDLGPQASTVRSIGPLRFTGSR